MRRVTVSLENFDYEAGKLLYRTLTFFGSLRAPRDLYEELAVALGYSRIIEDEPRDIDEVLGDIIVTAVEEEGTSFPQRADFGIDEDGHWWVRTPGNVLIHFRPPILEIDFQRDSKFASVCVIARMYEVLGTPELRKLLVEAASEV